ncbi:chaplin [Streptomyces longispororuber]|uniref:chaplin n=1 Tax=Streptomyces longispororuber TaxID=68230 RepID=UPI00272E197F|nr:chaplin [Streptomyces longispororuber]MCQ4212887.1 DUF320 domain-containing protein [Streptomyces longispororuber]
MAAAAATGILSMPGSSASAMTGDQEQPSGSPGVLSGNSVAAPLSVPVNLCGNTADVVGAVNPASGNDCSAEAGATAGQGTGDSAATASHSAGVLSGNSVQAPVDIGLNLCGDSVDVVGAANPASGNACSGAGEASAAPAGPETPEIPEVEVPPAGHDSPTVPPTSRSVPQPERVVPQHVATHEQLPVPEAEIGPHAPVARAQLADTGVDQNLLAAAATSAGLLVGGGVLYRRARAAGR